MNHFRVIIEGHRPRVVKAPTALQAIVAVCNRLKVRYADVRVKAVPVNRPSISVPYIRM